MFTRYTELPITFTNKNKIKLSGIETGATQNDTDANLRARASHTGTQTISTITDLQTTLDAKALKTTTVNGHALSTNVTVTKSDISLGNVDNTSDASKPVSTATQTALDLKANLTLLNSYPKYLYISLTQADNVSTGETDLITYTLPANTLTTTGQILEIEVKGTFTNSINAKTIKTYFGSAVMRSDSAPVSTTGTWIGRFTVRRTGLNAQEYVYEYIRTATGGGTAITSVSGTTTETETSDIIIKQTGTGGASTEISQRMMKITTTIG